MVKKLVYRTKLLIIYIRSLTNFVIVHWQEYNPKGVARYLKPFIYLICKMIAKDYAEKERYERL